MMSPSSRSPPVPADPGIYQPRLPAPAEDARGQSEDASLTTESFPTQHPSRVHNFERFGAHADLPSEWIIQCILLALENQYESTTVELNLCGETLFRLLRVKTCQLSLP